MKRSGICIFTLWILEVLIDTTVSFSVSSDGLPAPSQSLRLDIEDAVATDIRRAIQLSKVSSESNIAAVYDACSQWERILGDVTKTRIPPDIRVLTLAMYASCLVRIGKDEAALPVFEEALSLRNYMDQQSQDEISLEKAAALQRLQRYSEAQTEYLRVRRSDRAIVGASVCALRAWDLEGAANILRSSIHDSGVLVSRSAEVHSMCAIVDSLFATDTKDVSADVIKQLNATAHLSPVFRFAAAAYVRAALVGSNTTTEDSGSDEVIDESTNSEQPIDDSVPEPPASIPDGPVNVAEELTPAFTFLDFSSVNVGAFDDPLLELLDDKIRLHQLLSSNSRGLRCSFWPESFVLPSDAFRLSSHPSERIWVCKSRSGYGSHGNEVWSTDVALTSSFLMADADSKLLQRLVEPPLLLPRFGGRKFTVRVYVVYFSASSALPAEVHILLKGLVKLAALPYNYEAHSAEDVLRKQMTNSGRQDAMEQCDFGVLLEALEGSAVCYDDLWDKIRDSVRTLFLLYHDVAMRIDDTDPRRYRLRDSLGRLGIPKILGLDYILDDKGEPWLLEVNRFPGLEPRDQRDLPVKHYVVKEAWLLACRRQGLDDVSWLEWES
jgi:Tubulin-tyrosine ligase family